MKILKIMLNPRTLSTVVSAVSAIICALFAGCRLGLGELSVTDLCVEIGTVTNQMFHVEH